MVKRIDDELMDGSVFRDNYENWLGIDARAINNYYESLGARPSASTDVVSLPIEPDL
jgi:hypothetical protein